MKQNESVEKLETGKDYIDTYGYGVLIINRKGDSDNDYFYDGKFKRTGICQYPYGWREATEEEVIGAFKKHLVYRFGGIQRLLCKTMVKRLLERII